MIFFRVVGLLLFGFAAVQAIRMSRTDRQLQQFRIPGQSALSYSFVPVRWQKRLYLPEGHALVDLAWRRMLTMYAWGGAGMLFVAAGT